MIRRLPGWLNFLLLWTFYFAVGWLMDLVCGWHTDRRFIGFYAAVFCGAYLAKWRFSDGEWRFW